MQQYGLEGFAAPVAEEALFFAALPSLEASRLAYALGTTLKDRYSLKGHPMPQDRQHVTFQKIGEFPGAIPGSVIDKARTAAARIQVRAFTLSFDEVMNFGNPSDPAVALFGGNSAEVVQSLWEAMRQSLARENLPSPLKLATPHMTLLYGSSKIERQSVAAIEWQVTELVLIKSLLGQSRHEHLGRWPLIAQDKF
jgi:2'-5' RNA ligase